MSSDQHIFDQQTCNHGKVPLPLVALNHVSKVCSDVEKSAAFYRDILGFYEVRRPGCFKFEGAWLFNYCIGVHLIKGKPLERSGEINPKDEHVSFQSDNLAEVERRLVANGIDYVTNLVHEGGIQVKQVFFKDPDNNMIEICNCDRLPVVPVSKAGNSATTSDVCGCEDVSSRKTGSTFGRQHAATLDALLSPRVAVPTK